MYYLHNCPFYHSHDPNDNSTSATEMGIPFTNYVLSFQLRPGKKELSAENRDCAPWREVKVMGGLVLVFAFIQVLLLIWKLTFKPSHSLKSWKWWLWCLFVTCALTTLIVPVFFPSHWHHESEDIHTAFYPAAAVRLIIVDLGASASLIPNPRLQLRFRIRHRL
jgi:hypothetical protein